MTEPPDDLPVFALDEGLPLPVMQTAVRRLKLSIRIVAFGDLDPPLHETRDDELIRELDRRAFDDLFATDDSMLHLPEAQRAIEETQFSVVTCRRAQNNAAKACGLVLVHIDEIAMVHDDSIDQVWRLGTAPSRYLRVREL